MFLGSAHFAVAAVAAAVAAVVICTNVPLPQNCNRHVNHFF